MNVIKPVMREERHRSCALAMPRPKRTIVINLGNECDEREKKNKPVGPQSQNKRKDPPEYAAKAECN